MYQKDRFQASFNAAGKELDRLAAMRAAEGVGRGSGEQLCDLNAQDIGHLLQRIGGRPLAPGNEVSHRHPAQSDLVGQFCHADASLLAELFDAKVDSCVHL